MSQSDSNNPFQPPPDDKPKPHHPNSVFSEPHMQGFVFHSDEDSELAAIRDLARDRPSSTDAIDHTVWEEPALMQATPNDALTYDRWLSQKEAATSTQFSWWVTMTIASFSGVWAIIGAMASQMGQHNSILLTCIFAPVSEEIMKLALATWVVEKRPYLFKTGIQVLACAFVSGLVFSVIENLIYLNIYFRNPLPSQVAWRWTVCVALHVGCSTLAGFGLMKVWKQAITRRKRPELTDGSRMLISAMVLHGIYNTAVMLLWR